MPFAFESWSPRWRRAIGILSIVCIGLVPILFATNAYLYSRDAIASHDIHVLQSQGAQAHEALCSFKLDLKTRYDAGKDFLAEHPGGIPGVPASTIRVSLMNQRATLKSLDGLICRGT